MDDDDLEYPIPAPSLTKRDPIFFNKLSVREAGQWALVFALVYMAFNVFKIDLPFRVMIAGSLFMFGALFIHSPINGLAGIEHLYINLLSRLERRLHKTKAPENSDLLQLGSKPIFEVSINTTPLITITSEDLADHQTNTSTASDNKSERLVGLNDGNGNGQIVIPGEEVISNE